MHDLLRQSFAKIWVPWEHSSVDSISTSVPMGRVKKSYCIFQEGTTLSTNKAYQKKNQMSKPLLSAIQIRF